MTTNDLIEAAQTLADIIVQENEALTRVDFPAALEFLPAKEAALASLARSAPHEPLIDPAPHIVAAGRRLATLVAENRALLERSIVVQTRVIGIILRAVADAVPNVNYDANGQKNPPRRSSAMALSAQA